MRQEPHDQSHDRQHDQHNDQDVAHAIPLPRIAHHNHLLGERVHVTLDLGDATHLAHIITGLLLDYSEMGEVIILGDDQDIHHCWPGLRIERDDSSEPERVSEAFREAAGEL